MAGYLSLHMEGSRKFVDWLVADSQQIRRRWAGADDLLPYKN
jgi:hypothetical protein